MLCIAHALRCTASRRQAVFESLPAAQGLPRQARLLTRALDGSATSMYDIRSRGQAQSGRSLRVEAMRAGLRPQGTRHCRNVFRSMAAQRVLPSAQWCHQAACYAGGGRGRWRACLASAPCTASTSRQRCGTSESRLFERCAVGAPSALGEVAMGRGKNAAGAEIVWIPGAPAPGSSSTLRTITRKRDRQGCWGARVRSAIAATWLCSIVPHVCTALACCVLHTQHCDPRRRAAAAPVRQQSRPRSPDARSS